MKLLTLNTHSLMEDNYLHKMNVFVEAIKKHQPDVIALQEVMQPINESKSSYNCITCGKIKLKNGNHGINVAKALEKEGLSYYYIWLGIKKSYSKFDEGVALLTKKEPEEIKEICLSRFDEYENWKTRKALAVRIGKEWFYSVHTGWWWDKDSPLENQIKVLVNSLPKDGQGWLMGDFNSIATEQCTGYDMIVGMGLIDTYNSALLRDNGITATKSIDGWKNGDLDDAIRIDYIFCVKKEDIKSSYVIFNGKNEEIISDHYGIIVTVEREII